MDTCGQYALDGHMEKTYNIIRTQGPKYKEYARKCDRLVTYKDEFLIDLPIDVKELSDAGFFSLNRNDAVACYYCGIGIGNWELTDDPWLVHNNLSPNCVFIRLHTSIIEKLKPYSTPEYRRFLEKAFDTTVVRAMVEKFIPKRLIRDTLRERYINGDYHFPTYIEAIKSIVKDGLNKKDIINEQYPKCPLCQNNNISVAVLPCAHSFCFGCSLGMVSCDLCEKPIKGFVKLAWN